MDPEFMLSRLFGLPTAIEGLDDLFGGGGLMLVEASDLPVRDRIGGRAIATLGPFGTGKSLLSLQMSVEVARKGGVAWYMPLEQTAEECLYALESMGCLPDDAPLSVATTVPRALELLRSPDPERGALILLRSVKQNFADFLTAFEENVRLMDAYRLRLICVDPVSAMSQNSMGEVAERRSRMLQMFEELKQTGINIWLVAEEDLTGEDTRYEQNIADTVIHLCYENRHGYSQRYIEVTKSRLQREQRGRHAFAIGPGSGMTIYPSPAAVKSRVKTRSLRSPEKKIEFGVPSLDAVLGNGLYAGDVVVLQGPNGCSKTPVGLSFLLGTDWGAVSEKSNPKNKARSLLVSGRDNEETVRHNLSKLRGESRQVRIVTMEGGYIKPGYILQRIEAEFLTARLDLSNIGRVMVDNVAHWEFSCPYVREDKTFGDTLVDLLRRHRVTTVLTCGEPDSESVLQRSIIDSADCLIQFERIEFRGSTRVMVRVVKTREMSHRRETFELVNDSHGLQVRAASSLLRVGQGGAVSPVKVRLFLHGESDAQTAYNKNFISAVRAVLSRDAELEPENPIHSSRVLALGAASAVDELQVIQMDEFQLPAGKASSDLCMLSTSAWPDREWEDVIERLRDRVATPSGLIAVPYYENIGLLAYRSGVGQKCLDSWNELSTECVRWETEVLSPSEIFFDFPAVTGENYNSLFLEILLWLQGPPNFEGSDRHECASWAWLTSAAATDAVVLMRRLCRRAYSARQEVVSDDLERPSPFPVSNKAQVWRHWYSTLHQMLSGMGMPERSDIRVTTLPGGFSVAGEWFLTVPVYSAAPDVAAQIIQLCTTQEAEMDRVKHGIGLPVRVSFYKQPGSVPITLSPFFSVEPKKLLKVVETAFQRSSLGSYTQYCNMLSTYIQSILALPEIDETELRSRVRDKLQALGQRLAHVGDLGSSESVTVSDSGSAQHGAHTTSIRSNVRQG